jgi:hypothetical protein
LVLTDFRVLSVSRVFLGLIIFRGAFRLRSLVILFKLSCKESSPFYLPGFRLSGFRGFRVFRVFRVLGF